MGDSTPLPSSAAIKRAERLTRERFVFDGETLEEALAPGGARRRALDAALVDVEAGLKVPSLEWRQQYSLLLGLERVLSEDEPKLVDGTVLSAHQVDALSGTLTALLAGAQVVADAAEAADAAAPERLEVDVEIEADSGADRDSEIEVELVDDGDDDELEDDEDATKTRTTTRTTTTRPKTTMRPKTTTASRSTGSTMPTPTSTRTSRRRASTTTWAQPGASGSSTRPAPARRSRRSDSWRPRAPAAC